MNLANPSRRDFLTFSGAALLAGAAVAAIPLTGCKLSLQDLENYIPVALNAVAGIVTVLQAAGVIPPGVASIINTVKVGLDDLLTAIQDSAPAGSIVGRIELVIQALQGFVANLSLPATVDAVVTGLVDVILSTLMAFENALTPSPTTAAPRTFKVGARAILVRPKMRTNRAFKRDYNAIAVAGGYPGIALKMTFWERL
jgi:hypothetical protein